MPVFASKCTVIDLTHICGAEIGIIEKTVFRLTLLLSLSVFSRQFPDILHIFKMEHFEALPAHFEKNGYACSIHD